jgi:hypothetical protein
MSRWSANVKELAQMLYVFIVAAESPLNGATGQSGPGGIATLAWAKALGAGNGKE